MIELKNIVLNKKVLEIGGPSQLLNYLYDSVESIEMLNHKESMEVHHTSNFPSKTIGKYFGDATELQSFSSNNLFDRFDVVITSHTLEHISNPISAIKIWKKCLVPGGVIINIVPNKNFCWDANREYTTNQHFLEDYMNGTLESDMTHVHESSCMQVTRPNYYQEVGLVNETRIIHHHIFCENSLKFIHEHVGFFTKKSYVDDSDQLQMIYIGINE
jgi:predicted SAM-dependent methyltransferase